jgi:cephalosporin hydroxylase
MNTNLALSRSPNAQNEANEVDRVCALIAALPSDRLHDAHYLEHHAIPAIGLNNEQLHEQPAELNRYYGTGLRLWQYPNQFANFLVWLADNATDVECYAEIGCRWGGTFIVVCEWLKRVSSRFRHALAIDPIAPTPLIARYMQRHEDGDFGVEYVRDLSISAQFAALIDDRKPDIVFVDGDHTLRGALADHLLVREIANIVIHHDIASDACPDTTLLWKTLRMMERGWEFAEFTDQYASVPGSFLGIGCMRRLN